MAENERDLLLGRRQGAETEKTARGRRGEVHHRACRHRARRGRAARSHELAHLRRPGSGDKGSACGLLRHRCGRGDGLRQRRDRGRQLCRGGLRRRDRGGQDVCLPRGGQRRQGRHSRTARPHLGRRDHQRHRGLFAVGDRGIYGQSDESQQGQVCRQERPRNGRVRPRERGELRRGRRGCGRRLTGDFHFSRGEQRGQRGGRLICRRN